MHGYNNQGQSIMVANSAVDAIVDARVHKPAIWAIFAEKDYHEILGELV
jgi:hypothetical protein